jgi:hypothetical protein
MAAVEQSRSKVTFRPQENTVEGVLFTSAHPPQRQHAAVQVDGRMRANTDVGIEELFYNVYEMIMGQAPDGPNILHISYAAGLAIGIILFFNHAGKIKLNDDPTPFEVQMRLYERDVNDTLMINAGRKGEEADVDS